MVFKVTSLMTDFSPASPTRFQAQRSGWPFPSVPVKVILSSPHTMEKIPPPLRDCSMLKSVEFSSLTTGEPSGVMGDAVPLDDSNTGHIPTGFVPDFDQDAQSMTGNVS